MCVVRALRASTWAFSLTAREFLDVCSFLIKLVMLELRDFELVLLLSALRDQ
jgi:hypothetical protein